jgi:hypothetical protein
MSPTLPGDPTRFDCILLVMGVALLAGAGVGWILAIPLQVAVGAATVVAAAAMADGLVLNPPTE